MSQKGLPDGTKTGKGSLATEEIKEMWTRAYQIYQDAEGVPFDKVRDRTMRISAVARKMGITQKAAKRRVKNYEGWQKRINPPSKKESVPRSGRSYNTRRGENPRV